MSRVARPLNMAAVSAADEAMYAKYENEPRPNALYNADGTRRKLSGTDPSQEALRQEWITLYLAKKGELEAPPPPPKPCDDPTMPCPCKPISSISIVSLAFNSDHNLLKDYPTDWKDGGSRFAKPEWTPGQQHPITHSLDERVTVELELEVSPPDACPETGTLRGEGPGGLVFEKSGLTFKGGRMKVPAITSERKLGKKVEKLDFRVGWSTIGTSTALSAQTANVAYITIDTPRDPAASEHGVTLKRMDKAVSLVSPMGTTNPQTIVHQLMKKLPVYVLKANPAVPSDLRHPAYYNAVGGAWPLADYMPYAAECQTIVRFVRKIIKQIGAPGDAKMVYIYADPTAPLVAKEDEETIPNPALHSHLGFALVDKKVTHADVGKRFPPSHTEMPDGSVSLGLNAYEACLKFTAHDGPEGKAGPLKTYYYPGGTGGSRTDNIDDVLKHSFFALVEYAGAWYPNDNDPNKVWGFTITKIVADYTPFH